ncbi:DUF4912 domain-containing protein [Salinithrix halophila]|uniref:DUF4912 domain-containing protein n=1 Tax=Salinithrix halophila TaxID=1485204 RepID=A0ABV8JIU3_9BACL
MEEVLYWDRIIRAEQSQGGTGLSDESWDQRGTPDRLTLLVKNPWTLWAYWRVGDLRRRMTCEHFESDWAHLPFSLRLCNVTDLSYDGEYAHSCRVENVGPFDDRWYINGLEPGRLYLAEFGTWTIEGRFFALLRSNTVEAPPTRERRTSPLIAFGERSDSSRKEVAKSAHPSSVPLAIKEPWAEQFSGYTLVPEDKEVNR